MAGPGPRGLLFVISAPSGTGKSTLAKRLVERVPELEFSISYTTRPQRDGEKSGRDYHFVDREEFDRMVAEGKFLEWAEVFDHGYGTGIDATRAALEQGRHLLLDIDVQGARQVRSSGEPCISIMLLPPDYRTLEARLRGRGSDSIDQLGRRLARARREAQDYELFDFIVINDDLDRAADELRSIVTAERCRTGRVGDRVARVLSTFPRA